MCIRDSPYAGDLVFTAFSGSHQDAIKKGLDAMRGSNNPMWEVPYLPIDPADLGRTYEAVVRINSQSGKGGVAFLLEKDHGVSLPRRLQISMSQKIQKIADETGKEISTTEIWEIFHSNFVMPKAGHSFKNYSLKTSDHEENNDQIKAEIEINGENHEISGSGNGPIDAFVNALNEKLSLNIKVSDYHQSAISSGSDAQAGAYIELQKGEKTSWGVGINRNTNKASFEAIIVGVAKLI